MFLEGSIGFGLLGNLCMRFFPIGMQFQILDLIAMSFVMASSNVLEDSGRNVGCHFGGELLYKLFFANLTDV